MSIVLLAAVLLFVASPLTSKPAAAGATFTVNSTADAVDANPGDGLCRTAAGGCTLRAAVQEANALAGADTIILMSGTYTLTIGGAGENAAATGDLDITGDLTIVGAGETSTIIDGSRLDRILHILSGTVNISGVTIRNGKSGNGGGGIYNSGTLTLTNSTISANKGFDGGGGIVNDGTLTVVGSSISSNFLCDASDPAQLALCGVAGGGGILSRGILIVVGSTISGNNATPNCPCPNWGGGLANSGAATLTNVTVSGNMAEGSGFGIANAGTLSLTNGTVSNNGRSFGSASPYAAVDGHSGTTVRNTVVANNPNVRNCQGTITSQGYNMSSDGTCGFTTTGDRQNTNPLLGPLADNGGPTKTHALPAGSPAIDAGTAIGCPATDQRDVARPQGAACDIGAYEFVPGAPPVTYSISGQLLLYKSGGGGAGIPGVTVCGGDRCTNPPTDSNGNYTLMGLPPGPYTLTASKSGYTFSPASRTVNLSSNVTGQDFTGFDRPPIVFVPGFQGFALSTSCVGALPDDTFGRADNDLRAAAYYIEYAYLVSSWCNTPSLVDNMPRLRQAIAAAKDATGQKKLIIVAHSMGGLVSRAYIEGQDYADDVAELFTFGSPHLGVPEAVFTFLANGLSLGKYCADYQPAACDMSSPGMLLFNRDHPRRSGVRYHVISGDAPPSLNLLRLAFGALLPFQPNDSFVTASSGTGLSGTMDRYQTDEVHSTIFGSRGYFERDGAISLSYAACLYPILVTKATENCGTVSTRQVQALTQATASTPALSQHTPLASGTILTGQTATRTISLPGGPALFVAQWGAGTANATLTDPGGLRIDLAYAAAHPDLVSYQADATTATYYFPSAAAGAWQLALQAGTVPTEGSRYTTFTAFDSEVALTAGADKAWYTAGATATLTATLTGLPTGATVTATVVRADGVTSTVTLSSTGGGQYQATYTVATAPGYADVRRTAAGFQITSNTFALSGAYGDAPELRGPGSPNYAAINASVGITAASGGAVGLSADLAAADGTVVAHSVTSQAVTTGAGTLTLRFPGEAIYAAAKNGPYKLTNLLLTDQRGATLVAAEAQNVHTTAAYDYHRFVSRNLAMTGAPAKGAHGFVLGVQTTVVLQDGQGATLATDSTTAVSLRIKPGTGTPGAAITCSGGLSKTVSAGVAAFSGCIIDLKGDGYVLEATAGDATLGATAPMNIGWAGDANGDCLVDILDFSVLVRSFGKRLGDSGYDSRADLNGDNVVDGTDLSIFVTLFGTRCPSLVLTPTAGAVGTGVAVIGGAYVANREVSVTFDGTVVATSPATVTTDGSGRFLASFTVPAGTAAGAHVVKATQANGRVVAAASFTVP